jgi:hypothetical protein
VLSLLIIFCFFIGLAIDAGAQDAKNGVLFKNKEAMSIQLAYSFKEIKKNTNDSVFIPSVLYYQNDAQGRDSLKVSVRGRGNFRRSKCFFTPLRIKIQKSESKGTVFQGNKSLKLVLPCKVGKLYDDLVMKEYLCYQMYEPLTPYTFNTRLVNVTLTDRRGNQDKAYNVKAFFIEDDDEAARRFKGKVNDHDLHPRQLNDTCTLRFDFFEYMIANTDWSSSFQHNCKVVQTGERLIPIPYDFDMAGFVNAPYAEFSETLGIGSVRERVYRGYCRNENVVEFVRQDFIARMPKVFEVLQEHEEYFTSKDFTEMKKFIQDFLNILVDDNAFRNKILTACRPH